MNIYLVRHWRQNSRLCNVDVELSPEGRRQAELCGERLINYGIDAVYSSSLKRAVETADIINKYLNKERFIDARFNESNFGSMTGLETSVLKERYSDFLARRALMVSDEKYPGGGESSSDVYLRVRDGIDDIINKEYKNVCLVTHGGAMRALFTGICGAPPQRWLTFGRQLENCSISQLMYDEDTKTFHIERFNDYAHIEGHDELLRKHFGTGFFKPDSQT